MHQKDLTPQMIENIYIIKSKIDDQHRVKLQGALLRSKLPSFEKNEPSLAFLKNLEKRKGEENMIYSILEDNNSLSCKTDDTKKSIHDF